MPQRRRAPSSRIGAAEGREERPWHEQQRRLCEARNEKRCERLLDALAPIELDSLDWSAASGRELEPASISTLVYMRDVEAFVDRDFVGLPGHPNTVNDPLISRFLERWRAEEQQHAKLSGRFLEVYAADYGIVVPPRQPSPPSVPIAASSGSSSVSAARSLTP